MLDLQFTHSPWKQEQPRENGIQKLAAIFGASRSGTTWLGAIVSSHPEVVYRFEPFHRLKQKNAEIRQIFERIQNQAISSDHLSQIYQALLPAHPELEKPPFFAKNYPMVWPSGRSWMLPLARNCSVVSQLFQALYTPKSAPLLVFKEVEMVNFLGRLLAQTQTPIVYLMRHPCAVVWSRLRGQRASLMPTRRQEILETLLATHAPELAGRYGGKALTVAQKEALLWRVDVHRAVSACQMQPNGSIVIYEELVQQPLEVACRVLDHLGLDLSEESIAFIEDSTQGDKNGRQWGELATNPYFTVFRNSQHSCNAWKTHMSKEDRMGVLEIVEDSQPFKLAAHRGFWD